jgi:cytochrome P450
MARSATTDIYDPDIYIAGPPHDAYEELRRTSPVYWHERPDGPGYWAILKHVDVREISRHPERFSCWEKGVTIDTLAPEQLEISRGMLTNMDPPLHAKYREPMMASFTPRKIARLEDRVREIVKIIFARALDLMDEHGHLEFVHQICSPLPTQVFGELVGLPRESWGRMHDLAAQLTRSQDPDIVLGAEEKRGAGAEMLRYAIAFGNQRRTEPPRDDLTTVMLDTEFAGKRMSELEFGTHFCQFVVAGNETTVTLLSSGLQVLLEHPDQLVELRANPSLLPGAIEEILRFANPLHYLARTAKVDVQLRGAQIKAGDTLAMYYTSANRDEDVFANPQQFDIHRSPNPHVTFGFANHFCMGAYLARLEAKVFFEELLATFPKIEAAGPVKRLRSNFNNALKEFPVELRRN